MLTLRGCGSSSSGSGGGSSNITYLYRDEFITDDAAPIATPRTTEPGPGTLTTVQADGNVSINSHRLVYAAQATPVWGDQYSRLNGVSREAGRFMLMSFRPTTTGSGLIIGWGNTTLLGDTDTFDACLEFPDATNIYRNDPGATTNSLDIGDFADDTNYEIAIVLRATGAFYYFKGGTYTTWTLLWIEDAGSTATIYPAVSNFNFAFNSHFIRIPNDTYLQIPLSSDSFDRSNNTSLGSTDGAGHPEANGGDGSSWTEVNGDWEISTNKLQTTGSDPGGEGWLATVDTSEADVVEEAIVNIAAASDLSLALRHDGSTGFVVQAQTAATAGLYIHEWNGSSYTQRAFASDTVNASTDYRLFGVAEGTTIEGVFNDATKVSYGSASAGQTKTTHGIRSSGSGSGTVDNLVIWERTPPETLNQY